MLKKFWQGDHGGQSNRIISDTGSRDMVRPYLQYMSGFRTEYTVCVCSYQNGGFAGTTGDDTACISKFIKHGLFQSIFAESIHDQTDPILLTKCGRWDFPK